MRGAAAVRSRIRSLKRSTWTPILVLRPIVASRNRTVLLYFLLKDIRRNTTGSDVRASHCPPYAAFPSFFEQDSEREVNPYLRNSREVCSVEITEGNIACRRIDRIEFSVIEYVNCFELNRRVEALIKLEVFRERTVHLSVARQADITRTRIPKRCWKRSHERGGINPIMDSIAGVGIGYLIRPL
jgi:hypothetical protein